MTAAPSGLGCRGLRYQGFTPLAIDGRPFGANGLLPCTLVKQGKMVGSASQRGLPIFRPQTGSWVSLLDKPASGGAPRFASGAPRFAVLLHFTHLIVCQMPTYKTDAHTAPCLVPYRVTCARFARMFP